MEYMFKFYKHKHLMLLKDKLQNIEKYILYSLNNIKGTEEDKEEKTEKELIHREKKIDALFNYSGLIYTKIVNIIKYSSICITICEKREEREKEDEDEKDENIIGIVVFDYELSLNNLAENKNIEIDLRQLYYSLSLHIKNYDIISNLNCNNTLILNLIISDNQKYYHNLFYYLFHSLEDLVFILIFLKEDEKLENQHFQNGLILDFKNILNIENSIQKVILLNKHSYVNKIFLRLTSSSDIYDLHELFKKYSYHQEKQNKYLIYDIIEKKTDMDILITILNNKKKIIGFLSLKKNIDINILVNLYNLKDYNYLLQDAFFSDISPSLV